MCVRQSTSAQATDDTPTTGYEPCATSYASPHTECRVEDLTGKALGHYIDLLPIGRGGMASVYKAYHPGLDHYVAIKVLSTAHSVEEGFLERFRGEARSMAKLRHNNIVTVYEYSQEG